LRRRAAIAEDARMDRSKVVGVALVVVGVIALVPACKPNPSECYDKGDEKACQALCQTGKPEYTPTCFEIRARGVAACADGKGDCTTACESWKNAQASSDDIKNVYIAKLGSEAKVAAIKAKCAGK
jgi:hypothetical protein